MWKPAPRFAQTSIPCKNCKKPLMAKRTCHTAYLRCETCGRDFSVQDCIGQMDEELERFLEAINCDRV